MIRFPLLYRLLQYLLQHLPQYLPQHLLQRLLRHLLHHLIHHLIHHTKLTRLMLLILCGGLIHVHPGVLINESIAGGRVEYRVGERLAPTKKPSTSAFKDTAWDDLMPKDWNPGKAFNALNLSALDDADPRAAKALSQLQTALDNAPVVSALNGARIRIPGFLVPLENQRGEITEFLLVPYFGACVHTPPPPANQIIHVFPNKPIKNDMMEAVWVSGILETTRSNTGLGAAGYRLKAELVAPYQR